MSIVQPMVKPEMQGRVMGLSNTFATGITPLSLMVAGLISDAIGIRTWFWVAGIVTLLMGFGGFFSWMVMSVEDNHAADQSLSSSAAGSATDQLRLFSSD